MATSRIVVCEYADTSTTTGDPIPGTDLWLVASEQLPGDVAADVATRVQAGSPADGGATTATPFGPVLRLAVLGADGNIRTLQSITNLSPPPVTDGRHTVTLGAPDGTGYPPLPTPFDPS